MGCRPGGINPAPEIKSRSPEGIDVGVARFS